MEPQQVHENGYGDVTRIPDAKAYLLVHHVKMVRASGSRGGITRIGEACQEIADIINRYGLDECVQGLRRLPVAERNRRDMDMTIMLLTSMWGGPLPWGWVQTNHQFAVA